MGNPNLVRKPIDNPAGGPGEVSIFQAQTINKQSQNYIINGGFDFWQRAISANIPGPSFASAYAAADRVRVAITGSGNFTVSRATDSPTTDYQYCYRAQTNGTYSTTTAATQLLVPFEHRIEGTLFRDLHQKVITISFWFKANFAGTYSIALVNSALNRSYVTNFTIPTAATWTLVSKTIQLDTGGTYVLDSSGYGISIFIGVLGGTNSQAATNDVWAANARYTSVEAAATNWGNIPTSSYIQISQLAVNLGTSAGPFRLFGGNYISELQSCQRYYEKSFPLETAPGFAVGSLGTLRARCFAGSYGIGIDVFKVTKRANPSLLTFNPVSANATWRNIDNSTDAAVFGFGTGPSARQIQVESTAFTANATYEIHWTADAEL